MKKFAPYFIVAIVLSALAIPLVLSRRPLSWCSVDELGYHYVTVREFQSQWPHLDFRDYPSPQTPLYHVILAAVCRLNDNIITLRLVSFAMSLGSVLIIERYLITRSKPAVATFFTILIAISPYFLGAAVRLLTDNLALGAAIAALFALDDAFHLDSGRSISGAVLGAVSVLTRQIYVWLAPVQFFATFTHRHSERSQRIVNVVLSTVPALSLVPFVVLWHGLTPLSWVGWSNRTALSINLDVPIFILSLLGVLGSAFIFTMSLAWKSSECSIKSATLLAGIGVITLLVHPFAIVRGGWLLAAGRLVPKFLGTPLIFWILFPLGLVYLYILLMRQLSSGSYFILIALLLWTLGNSISAVVFQRYYEPMEIFFLAYILSPLSLESRREWLIPSGYLLGCLSLDLIMFYSNQLQTG